MERFSIAGILKDDGIMYYIDKNGKLTTNLKEAKEHKNWGYARNEIFNNRYNEICLGWFVFEQYDDGSYQLRDSKTTRFSSTKMDKILANKTKGEECSLFVKGGENYV